MKKIFTLLFSFIFLISFSQTFILPSSGVQSTYSGGCPIGTCSGTLLDPGGTGNYSNNINQIYQTICPTTPGNCLSVTFSAYNTESGFDYLTIGNGPAQNSAVFTGAPANASGQIWGTPATPFSYTANNSSGCLTFRFNSDFTATRSGFTASITCAPCGAALASGNSDACASTFLCSNLGFNDVSNGPGTSPGEGCGGTSCVTGEVYSNWYKIAVATSGSLTFTVDPNTNTDDFDYSLYGPNVSCGALGTTVRCSYAATTGNTGLGSGAVDVSEDVSGNGWTAPINVTAGQTYMLLVNNWTAGGAGFNVLFGGTATLGTPPAAVNSPTICNGQSAILSATPVATGGTYTWTPGGLNTSAISVSPSSNTTYSVTYSLSGCTSAVAVSTVIVNATPIVAIASVSSPTICSGNSSLITPNGAATYTLLNTGATGTSFNVSPTSTTTYSIVGESASNCPSTNTITTTITVNTTPTVAIASVSSPTICSGNSSLITPSSAATYTLLNSGATGTSFNVSPTSTTTYSIIGTSASACPSTNTITTTITVNATPTVAISSVSSPTICSGNSSLITPSGASTYTLINSGATGTSFNVSPTSTTTYSIVGESTSNCPSTNTITTTITVNTTPTVAIASVSSPTICSGNSSLITPSSAATYTLLNTGATGTSFNVSPTSTTTYSIVGESTSNCPSTNTITTTITVNAIPSSTASVTGSVTCLTTTVNLNSTSIAGASYTWTSPSGASILSPGANANNTIGDGAGTYTLNITSSAGCSFSTTANVSTDITSPTGVSAGANQTLVCGAANVTLAGTATPTNSTINWLGGVCGSATSLTTTACAPNTYTLVVLHPVSGCSVSSVMTVSSSTSIPQATVDAITNSITCTNTVVAIGVTSPDPVTYLWTGPGISGATNTSATTATLAGTYTVVVTNSLTTCSTTLNATVQSDLTSVTATVSLPGFISCTNTLVTLSSSPIGSSYTYTWSGTGIVTSVNSQTVNVTQGGNFVVAITNTVNGCPGSYTLSVPTFTAPPTVTITPSSFTTSCAIPTVQLVASSTSGDLTYSWTPNGGTLDFNNISNPIATGGGTYDVVVTNTISGCQSMATATVVPDAGVPVISVSANSLTITCTNTTVTTAITSTNTTLSYTWSPLPVTGGANPVFNTQGIYNATITASNGCTTYTTINVDINNSTPTVTLSSISNKDTLTCTKLFAVVTPTVPPSSDLTYTWSPGTGISTPINQANATFTASGIYTLAITNTLTGCVSTTTNSANTFTVVTDTIRPTAIINVTSTNTIIGCGAGNSTVTFSSTTTSSNTPITTWLPGGATTPTLNATAGVYTLVVVDAVNSCSATAQFTVNGNTTPPQNVSAGTLVSIPCGSLTVALTGTTTSANVNYLWSGPSATSIASGSITVNPTVNEIGIYTLTVTDNLTGCQSTATVNVAQANVTAAFTANPTSGASPLTVNFTDASTGATNFSWNFGGSNSSPLQNPSNTFTTGTYTVTLIASSGVCMDTATIVIVIEDGFTLEIPNVFTPNNDKSNDLFTIKSTGVKEISLQIFNRWGQKLYEFTGPKASWDGLTNQGGEVHEGTYFYFVKASGFDGKEVEKNGTVNLFR